jgi:hypothetical protein
MATDLETRFEEYDKANPDVYLRFKAFAFNIRATGRRIFQLARDEEGVMPKIATCKSCGASIIWAETPAGKPAPLDAKVEMMMWCFMRHGKPFCRSVRVHKSHFATCPNADQHRKQKEG